MIVNQANSSQEGRHENSGLRIKEQKNIYYINIYNILFGLQKENKAQKLLWQSTQDKRCQE